jgi:hemophore
MKPCELAVCCSLALELRSAAIHGDIKLSANCEELSMKATTRAVRRALCGVFATCLAGGAAAAVLAVPAATAANDPCAASEIARTIGSVATSTATYLDAHPETNLALTAAAQQPGPQGLAAVKTYLDANTQASKDLQSLQQPLQNLSGRCRLPVSLPQLLQFLQAAQNGQAANGAALPVGMSLPQNATAPTASGPLPGPLAAPSEGTRGTPSAG